MISVRKCDKVREYSQKYHFQVKAASDFASKSSKSFVFAIES